MGEHKSVDKSEDVPIYQELASELCDPADTAWHFPPKPSFVADLVADEEETAAAS